MPKTKMSSDDIERLKALLVSEINTGFNTANAFSWTGTQSYTKLIITKGNGKLAQAVSTSDTTIDFGQSMTVSDWVMIEADDTNGSAALEWLLIGSNVSGTTYNVTRNVDGSGANAWANGTSFIVIGANGDFRIEIIGGNPPSIKLIEQGATYSTNTEYFIIDDSGVSLLEGTTDDKKYKIINSSGNPVATFYGDTSGSTIYAYLEAFLSTATQAQIKLNTLDIQNENTFIILQSADDQDRGYISHTFTQAGSAQVKTPLMNPNPMSIFTSWPNASAAWYGTGFSGSGSTAIIPDHTGGAHHLTNNNTIVPAELATGLYPDVTYLNFVAASSHYASRAIETAFSGVTSNIDFFIVVRIDALPTGGSSYGVAQMGSSTESWSCYITDSSGVSKFRFRVYNSGGTATTVVHATSISANTWHVIRCHFVQSSDIHIIVDGVKTSGTAPSSIRTPVGNFQLGAIGASNYLNGKILGATFAYNNASDAAYYAAYQGIRDYVGI